MSAATGEEQQPPAATPSTDQQRAAAATTTPAVPLPAPGKKVAPARATTEGAPADADATKAARESAAAAAATLASVKEVLARAEQDWQQGERLRAVAAYDEALAIAVAADNQELRGQILLGKGFALMQPALQQKQEEFIHQEASKRTGLAIDADAGLSCLRQTLTIAEAAGRTAQVAFVKKLIEQRGYFALPKGGSCGSHSSQASGDGDGGCAENDTEAIAKAVAQGDLPPPAGEDDGVDDNCDDGSGAGGIGVEGARSGRRKRRVLWTAKDEQQLITLVAEEGVDAEGWDGKAQRLREQRADCAFTVEDVRLRWAAIAPRVKEELKRQDEKRACGHTCGTCPTRPTCKLHDAVDLEVADDW